MTDQNATLVARHIKDADTVLPVLTHRQKSSFLRRTLLREGAQTQKENPLSSA